MEISKKKYEVQLLLLHLLFFILCSSLAIGAISPTNTFESNIFTPFSGPERNMLTKTRAFTDVPQDLQDNQPNEWSDILARLFLQYIWWILLFLGLLLITVVFFVFLIRHELKLKTRALWKRNRQLTSAKEKAEENERLKTVFLQNMSHELRTPLSGMLGFMGLLKNPDLDQKTRKKYIDLVIQSGNRLLTTINNIIEISKIDSNQISVHPTKVDVLEVMQFLRDFFIPQAREKNIELRLKQEIPPEEGIILVDQSILDNILINLIGNAIKFTNKGFVEFGSFKKGEYLVFSVKDTGVGIPESRQDFIFDRFVQADPNLTRSHKGSGLGLAIVKAYVEALGGHINLESTAGKGTEILVSIPYTPATPQSVPNDARETSSVVSQRPIKILVAEDDQISYLFIRKILDCRNITLVRTTSGPETVDRAREDSEIDLILMDIKMAGMDGFEATKAIREFNTEIPIIIQSAYNASIEKEKAIQMGCSDYIAKPIDREHLLRLIRMYT